MGGGVRGSRAVGGTGGANGGRADPTRPASDAPDRTAPPPRADRVVGRTDRSALVRCRPSPEPRERSPDPGVVPAQDPRERRARRCRAARHPRRRLRARRRTRRRRRAPVRGDHPGLHRPVLEGTRPRRCTRPSTRSDAALGLWRGTALEDVADDEFVRGEVARLEELRWVTIERRMDLLLRLGRHSEAAGVLSDLVGQMPLRERLREQLVLALYRSGRQADALRAYDAARKTLSEELGLDPGSDLQALERAVLDHDPTLDWVAPERGSTTRGSADATRPGDDATAVDLGSRADPAVTADRPRRRARSPGRPPRRAPGAHAHRPRRRRQDPTRHRPRRHARTARLVRGPQPDRRPLPRRARVRRRDRGDPRTW